MYIKQRIHTEPYYDYGRQRPEVTAFKEIWFNGVQMAIKAYGLKVIVDTAKNKMWVSDIEKKYTLEADLPLKSTVVLDKKLQGVLKDYRMDGKVQPTEKAGQVDKRTCTIYQVKIWRGTEGDHSFEGESENWYTSDTPFDLKKFNAVMNLFTPLENCDLKESFNRQLCDVNGFLMKSAKTRYTSSATIKSDFLVTEISKVDAGSDTFTVPAGLTKKEALSLQDLRTMLFGKF
ncbi:MAG: hypothetical protein GY765_42720 [bacterium]|nr:hypothetical protein [bacterium]